MISNLYWLTEVQMERLRPYFPKSRNRARVDDRRVLSGVIFFNRNGLHRSDAPAKYGRPKTSYNRWSDMGVFARIMMGLAKAKSPLADRRYDADWLWDNLMDKGTKPCIPGGKSPKKTVKYDKRRYKRRNCMMFGGIKDWRRVATRYDRSPTASLSAIARAATIIFYL